MRITGGKARSITIKTLDIPDLRPATDAMRQAVFNSLLANGIELAGCTFLDIFAGSGAYGLEAISHGATHGTWVEKNPKLRKILEVNLAAVAKSAGQEASHYSITIGDALRYSGPEGACDLVFCDPPYAMIAANLDRLAAIAHQALRPGGVWLMEHPAGLAVVAPEGWEHLRTLGGAGPHKPNVGMMRKI